MARSTVAVFAAFGLAACSAAPPETEGEVHPATRRDAPLAVPAPATGTSGRTFAIHLEGLCSTSFHDGKGDPRLGSWPGIESIAPEIDQRESMAVATSQLVEVLETYCTGEDWCFLYTYSNGGAVLSRTLSLHEGPFNILFALNSASNEGGSELGGFGWLGETVGGCPLSGYVGPSDHRAGWNHHDTNGVTFYQIGGYDGWWYSSALLPGEDDGAVAYHSAGAYVRRVATDWLCGAPEEHWASHFAAWTCEGYPLDHKGMKGKGICELGGGC